MTDDPNGTSGPPAIISGRLLLTGAAGFVGRRLVDRLARAGRSAVTVLTRDATADIALADGWQRITGDLARAGSWVTELQESGIETVVHLAARTGKASRKAHRADNLDATRALVAASRESGVNRFLLVSTIAAGFPNRKHYHYADAKVAAEAAVLASGLDALVLRPTPVLGPGSPVLASLERLARMPIPIIFGPNQLVQPVHVEDLVDTVVAALGLPHWGGRIVELGGPVTLTNRDLLQRIRAERGLAPRRFLTIPFEPLRTILAAVEPLLLPFLPFTAGQLAAFANPAVAGAYSGGLGLPRPSRGLDDMLS